MTRMYYSSTRGEVETFTFGHYAFYFIILMMFCLFFRYVCWAILHRQLPIKWGSMSWWLRRFSVPPSIIDPDSYSDINRLAKNGGHRRWEFMFLLSNFLTKFFYYLIRLISTSYKLPRMRATRKFFSTCTRRKLKSWLISKVSLGWIVPMGFFLKLLAQHFKLKF